MTADHRTARVVSIPPYAIPRYVPEYDGPAGPNPRTGFQLRVDDYDNARAIAGREYKAQPLEFGGWGLFSRGSDGGWHLREEFIGQTGATLRLTERVTETAARIMVDARFSVWRDASGYMEIC